MTATSSRCQFLVNGRQCRRRKDVSETRVFVDSELYDGVVAVVVALMCPLHWAMLNPYAEVMFDAGREAAKEPTS